MTYDNATHDAEADRGAALEPAAEPVRRARRSVSRPAGPPLPGVEGVEGADDRQAGPPAVADQSVPAGADPVPEPASAPVTAPDGEPSPVPARKRATAKKTAKKVTKATKAASAGRDVDTTPAATGERDEPGEGDQLGETTPPAKKATRKRAAKKTAGLPAEGDETPATPDVAPAATAATGTIGEKPARARASRSRRPATAADEEHDTLPQAADEDAVSGLHADLAEPARSGATPVAAPVLFQAPDPGAAPARRRRRAQAPAGPPSTDGDERGDQGSFSTQAAPDGADGASSPGRRTEGAGEGRPSDGQVGDRRDDERADRDDGHHDGQADEDGHDDDQISGRKRRRRGGRGRRRRGDGETADSSQDDGQERADAQGSASGESASNEDDHDDHDDHGDDQDDEGSSSSRRRRRRRRRAGSGADSSSEDPPGTVTKVRQSRKSDDEVASVKGSTRLEAKKQRRRDGREAGRRKQIITESEFLARRESVERTMIVRERAGRTQIAVLEDDVLVEHYVANETNTSMIGNVYLGRVQNVLPSMEAAFVDIGKGRNAVLYAGEVNWDAAGLEGQPRRIEQALKSGDTVLVQVTKDPLGHKGARLTSQVSLPGRYLVYVPNSSMTGISRKLPDTERSRLKKILKAVVPEDAGVIVRTAAEGASEEELARDVARLSAQWADIQKKSSSSSGGSAPKLLHGEPDLTIRVVRDVFNEDFAKLVVSGNGAWDVVQPYLEQVAPDLAERASRWTSEQDVFAAHRVDEQLAKAMDRKVYLPSGGSLVIDRTEAMTVVDVNTGKFTGAGGNLEETVTRNNLEAAEEIVRQLRLRDIGGIIVVDFIDMVLESNRDLVLRRLVECLGRDRTKHQVAEVTSLGLVQMTRKRVGQGLLEVFSEPCEHCNGRGIIIHSEPVSKNGSSNGGTSGQAPSGSGRSRRGKGSSGGGATAPPTPRGPIPAGLVASLAKHHDDHEHEHEDEHDHEASATDDGQSDTGRAETGQAESGQAESGQAESGQAEAGQAEAGQAPGEAAVADLSASTPETAGVADDAPASEAATVGEPPAPAARPRRRRRASAPAGPPASHGSGQESG